MSDSYLMISGGFGLIDGMTKEQKDCFMDGLRDLDAMIEEYANESYSFTIVDSDVMPELRAYIQENVNILAWASAEADECYPVDYFDLGDIKEDLEDEQSEDEEHLNSE